MNNHNKSPSAPEEYGLKTIVNPELLEKIATYFSLFDNPDAGLSQEQVEVNAGKYFAENIADKYSPAEINAAFFMSR
jgi:hypothetical protein